AFRFSASVGTLPAALATLSPLASYFSLQGQRKVTKRKALPLKSTPFEVWAVADFRTRHPWLDRKRRASCAPPSGSCCPRPFKIISGKSDSVFGRRLRALA